MTAELEEQEAQSDKIVEEKIPEDEKIQSDESPQNGGGNDLKEQEEVETQPSGGQEEVVVAAVAPRRRIPRFLQRLVQRGRHQNSGKQDTEAGTELLAKDGKVEIKEEDGKHEKNDSGTDVTVAITDDHDVTGDAGDASRDKGKGQGDASGGQSYWRRVVIGLAVIILVLVVISVISIMTSPGSSQRGPMVAPLVITDCGPLKGFIENNVYIFRGIPYALPPIGERRWKPPMTASNLNECWTGTYEAYNASAYCFQKLTSGLNLEMSEDCLYLDVITPSLSALALRPVVVYIPGDLPLQGYSSADIEWRPSPALIDEKDVIFITINYRTNVFGFLAVDILTNSVRPPTSGNYGLMDMLAALKWVQRNIRSFGGDPEKVTVLANGGGATAGLALLSSKKGHALFSQMWLTGPSAHFSNETLEKIGTDNSVFLRKLGCESGILECLYNKTSEEILDATPNFWALDLSTDLPSIDEEPSPVMAVIDGNVLYDTPFNMWNQGDINQVPVVIGATAQESGSSRILPDLDSWNWTDFHDYVTEKLGTINSNMTESALQFYIKNLSTPHEQFHTMVSDIRVICPLENLIEVLDGVLEKDVYWYVVDYKPSSAIQFSNDTASARMSVHGLDIAAIFGILDHYITPVTSADERFQNSMQELFFSFVRKGTPEIAQEYLMTSNFINLIGDQVRSRMTPYENCQVWRNAELYPKYAKMN